MKDLGRIRFLLGIVAIYSSCGLHLTQTKYVLDLLHCMKFQDVKAISSPALSAKKLSLYNGDPRSDPTEYWSVVGAL